MSGEEKPAAEETSPRVVTGAPHEGSSASYNYTVNMSIFVVYLGVSEFSERFVFQAAFKMYFIFSFIAVSLCEAEG